MVSLHEAIQKQTYLRFRDVYMPAFRQLFEDNNREHCNPSQSHPIIGKLVNRIRTGHTTVPPQYEDELLSMNLDVRNQKIVKRDQRWENEYMPVFRQCFEDNNREHCNPSQIHPIIGGLARDIRTGYTTVPPQY